MKICVYSTKQYDKPFLEQALTSRHEVHFTSSPLSLETVHEAEDCQGIVLFTADKCTSSILSALSKIGVRYIALRSTGYDHVDIASARSLGIRVANVPSYSPQSIAEHTAALLLAALRSLKTAIERVARSDFRLDGLTGSLLHHKTVGIIGFGNIGKAFARIMKGFGCRIVFTDPAIHQDTRLDIEAENVPLAALIQQADIISLHCPLNESTQYMINTETLSAMKNGIIIVNTSRGGLINTSNLLTALDNGKVRFACLDVYENEGAYFFADHSKENIDDLQLTRLIQHPHVILTGHQAFLTDEALTVIAETTLQNLNDWETNGSSQNEIG
jgi:D-lactate dehydrogenase